MSFTTRFQGSTALIAAALVLSPAAAMADGDDEEDKGPHVVIGKAIGGSNLVFGFEATEPDPQTGAIVIPIDTFGDPLPGFTGLTGFQNIPFDEVQDLAFEAPDADEVEELAEFGFDAVPDTSDISVEAVSLPSDFSVFLLGQPLLDTTGQSLELGSPEFDVHPTYVLETTDPLTPGQTTTGTFKFVDTTGTLSDSATFDITLVVVPEPTTATLALGGAALLLRRRRAMR
ncbi:MAG: hypothetical protein AAF593_12935 [Planctomycetota bacterium]